MSYMVFVTCGYQSFEAKQITAQSSIGEIRAEAQRLFDSSLPKYYDLMFYSRSLKKLVTLNDNIINSDKNPIRSTTEGSNDSGYFLELHVVDTSKERYECHGKDNFVKNISQIIY